MDGGLGVPEPDGEEDREVQTVGVSESVGILDTLLDPDTEVMLEARAERDPEPEGCGVREPHTGVPVAICEKDSRTVGVYPRGLDEANGGVPVNVPTLLAVSQGDPEEEELSNGEFEDDPEKRALPVTAPELVPDALRKGLGVLVEVPPLS